MPKRRHTTRTIAGLEDATAIALDILLQTRAQEERLKRLLCILGELRQGPEEYKADQPAGLRPVGWDGIDDVGG